jgi:nitrogen regulatory protein PII
MEQVHMQHFKLLITIVDRGKGQTATKLFDRKVPILDYIIPGRGTAKKEILNLLGIGDTAKDVVFSLMSESLAETAISRLQAVLQFDRPGSGIAFTHPIGSIGGQRVLSLMNSGAEAGESPEKEQSMEARQYDLIIAITDKGHSDHAMDAARTAGARGGTIIHSRGAGVEEAEKFFGLTIQPEKEILMIIVRHENRRAIMEAICHTPGFSKDAHGVVFSLPVDEVVGLSRGD